MPLGGPDPIENRESIAKINLKKGGMIGSENENKTHRTDYDTEADASD